MVWLFLRQGADGQVQLKDNLASELRMTVGISEEAISQYDRQRGGLRTWAKWKMTPFCVLLCFHLSSCYIDTG